MAGNYVISEIFEFGLVNLELARLGRATNSPAPVMGPDMKERE